MSLRGAGLVAALVISGGLWLYGHGGGGGNTEGTAPAYCHDVERLTGVLTDVKQSGNATAQAATLSSIASSLKTDVASASPIASASLTRVAADVNEWRTAIISNDAVDQTIALDRVLSDLSAVPGC